MNWNCIYWCGVAIILIIYITIILYVTIYKRKGSEMKKERATELEFLRWFVCSVDFGPGDSDVKDQMKRDFISENGMNIPEGYNLFSDGETTTDC